MTKKTVTTPATPAADVQAQAAEARNNLFQVYPEIQKLYDSFGSPETTLATQWFDKEVSERIGKFVVLIRKLELDELFPNFSNLEKVSSLTDGGTINEKLLRALEDLCKKAFQINSRPEDEIFQTKGYRGIAIYLRNANLWDEIGSDNSIITKGLKLFGLDVKAIKDCIDVERLLNELGIEE
jgi:hypothetical protein